MCQAAYFNSVIYDDTRQRQCYVRPDASGCILEARSREGRDANSTTRRYRQGNPAVKGDTAHLVAQLRFQLLEEVVGHGHGGYGSGSAVHELRS